MPMGDIHKLAIRTRLAPQNAVNVRYWRTVAEAGGGTSRTNMADFFDTLFGPLMKAAMSDQATYQGCDVSRVFPLPPSRPVTDADESGPGTRVADPMSPQTCGLITLRTEFGGRKYRGRMYVPFPSELDNSATGRPTPGYVAALAGLITALTSQHVIGGLGITTTVAPVIYRKVDNSYDFIVAGEGRDHWATQRRRSNVRPDS